jgi:signal transduction histidine kinase
VEGGVCLLWSGGDDAPLRLEAADVSGGEREALARALVAAARETFATGQTRELDPEVDPRAWPVDAPTGLGRAILVPMSAYGRVTGVLAVAQRPGEGGGSGAAVVAERTFLETLADLAALARDQARRFDELERARTRLEEGAARLRREERLAALGEVARRAAQEARNPLASIGAFARRLQRSMEESDANREYLEIIVRESERLERLLAEEADATDPEPPAFELASLNALAQEAIQAAGESLVRHRIRMLKRLAPELPLLLLDTARVRRAIANLLENALDAARSGGRLRVETRRASGNAVLEIAHDGGPIAGGVLDQLFVPFASARPGGPAVGLAVAQQIVRGHGGEIRVRSEGEWTAIVTITLPLRGNEDRRSRIADRRSRRPDRRTSTARS